LVELAGADGAAALAITDTANLFGALEFSEKLAAAGIQPIIGCTLALDFVETGETGSPASVPASAPGHRPADGEIALLAKDAVGYANLMQLTSAAYLESADPHDPRITLGVLRDRSDGLIALTGGPEGPIDRAIDDAQPALARTRLDALRGIFGDRLYVELQRHGLESEREVEPTLIGLAYDTQLPLVASNEAYFADAADYEAHDALICISQGAYVAEDERRRLTPNHSFKSQAEMVLLFADLPEALANTVEIARRSAFRPVTRAPILPRFVAAGASDDGAAQVEAEADELERQARAGLEHRLEAPGPAEGVGADDYRERLAFELDVIRGMKYPGYFLIVSDFIKWAKARAIPVGPGRGSGAGSVVAWALTITDLDPIRFGLLFERFLNPERVSMPDFDIDFCQDRRDEVIHYVQQKYGADRVAQIITFGKLQARAVLRDVGRVLHMPYGQVDRLCKLVPNNPANPVTLAEAIEEEPRLGDERDNDPMVASLLTIGQKLEGLYRHASTHAAGVVIADRPLTELVPLYRDPRSDIPATQFNMKWVEAAGLVKFDFLGLKTLTVIQKSLELINEAGTNLDLATAGLDDPATYDLLARGQTVGVFQLESTGMRDSLRKLKPDRFEDIIAMVSLYRPGPMDNIPTYINRKHGLEEVEYPHPMLEPILAETYGVIIYQEQVMQIAQVLSGYSLGEADLLRRAMGKKIKAEMAKQRSRFVDGAVANGVDKARAGYIFELVDKFAGYGFNKSHGAAYALLAYQTAYLKANHPVAFLAASMTLDMANTDKLALFAEEVRALGHEIAPPSINASGVDFRPEGNAIRYSMAALKNVGRGAVEGIVAERRASGPFADLEDFASRIDPRTLNKRVLETLASAGAFDPLVADRAVMLANTDNLMAAAQRMASDREVGQDDLFGAGGSGAGGSEAGSGAALAPVLELAAAKPWLASERLAREFDAVGFYLSGHPLDEYESVFPRLDITTWSAFVEMVANGATTGTLAGTVMNCRERRSKSGNRFAFAAFSDQTGQFEAVLFSDVLEAAGDLLSPGNAVLVRVEAERDGDSVKLRANSVTSLDLVASRVMKGLTIVLDGAGPPALGDLKSAISPNGKGAIRLRMNLPDVEREVEVQLKGRFDVSPARAGMLRVVPGVCEVLEH